MALEGVLPVADVIRTRSLRSSSIVVVIKGGFLVSSDVFNQIIGRLISNVRILLQEDGILADFISNLVFGILRVLNTEGNISVKGTCWGFLGVTVTMFWGWVMGSTSIGVMMRGVMGHRVGNKLEWRAVAGGARKTRRNLL